MIRLYKIPKILRKIYPEAIWTIPNNDNAVYLTFDDGPCSVTNFVLDTLEEYNAKASFFMIGDNIIKNKEIFDKVLQLGHTVGNHTFNHLKGFNTDDSIYLENVLKFKNLYETTLFRPPYGRLKKSQYHLLIQKGFRIVLWDIITYDYDKNLNAEFAYEKITRNIEPGSIIVMHDSFKAEKNLKFLLPKLCAFLKSNNYICKAI